MGHRHNVIDRRLFLQQALLGSGLLGLRSVMSGLPPLAIANPARFIASMTRAASAQATSPGLPPQYLILSTSDDGEPLNCNVPGMYTDTRFKHPTAPQMAPTQLALGGQSHTAAGCWSMLAAEDLNRANFFHLATGNFQHGGLGTVHRMNNRIPGGEMLISALSKRLQPLLGTIQPQPIVLSGDASELISYGGIAQAVFTPTFIRDLLTTPAAQKNLQTAQALRDRDLDALNAALKEQADPVKRVLIDAYATTQKQARQIPQELLTQLSAIADNGVSSQVTTAIVLCQLKLTPAVVIHLPFGGDNHSDEDSHDGPGALPAEGAQHVASVGTMAALTASLRTQKMQDAVTFATLTTFGRSNASTLKGRSHNGQHSCNIMIGTNVRAGVTGGATLVGQNPVATGIDPVSGLGQTSNGIAGNDTLGAYGATLMSALGLPDTARKAILPDSQAVAAATLESA